MKSLFLIGVFCLFSAPATVSACGFCLTPDPAAAFNSARMVFIGRMLGGTEKYSLKNDAGKAYVLEAGQVRFSVEEIFKGNEAAEVTLHVDRGDPARCPVYGLERGKRYVVYAHADEKNPQITYTGRCTRTRIAQGKFAKEDLDYLRNLPPRGSGGNIRGNIYADVYSGKDMPLPDVRVKITAQGGQVITVFTNKKGEYEVKQLKPGKYKVEPELPPNFTSEQKIDEVDVDDLGTANATFVAFMDGKVSGRVFDTEGNSFSRVALEMVAKGESVPGFSTGDDGGFEVEGAPPGEYVLYMEVRDKDGKRTPYYYPGTFQHEKAGVIRVGLGEKVEGLQFRLPSGSIVRTIEGEVVWKDGTPAANEEVWLTCAQSSTADGLTVYFWQRTQTNNEGRFRIEAFTGESYVIMARGRKKNGELVEMHSPNRKIAAGESVKELKLTLSEDGLYSKERCSKF